MLGSTSSGNHAPSWLDGAALLVVTAVMLAVAAVAVTAVQGLDAPRVAIVFGVLIAAGELIRIRLPDERAQAPIGFAGALGYAILSQLPGDGLMDHSTFQVIAVVSVAMVAGTLPHVLVGRVPELEGVARRLLVVAAVAAVFRPLVGNDSTAEWLEAHQAVLVILMIVLVALAWPLEALIAAGVRAARVQAPLGALFRNELKAMLGIGAAIASTGVLFVLAAREVGLWALPVFSAPLLLAQISFRRYTGIRRTRIETIRALSRATEIGDYTEVGHPHRVARLAVDMGRQLGLDDDRLRRLEYAALMHDIGLLSLTDPIPGGATVLLPPDEKHRLAAFGGEIIREAGMLDDVARIVEAQAEPYRRPHVPDDVNVLVESRIIKVANAYDDLAGSSSDLTVRAEALERLRLGMAYEYDPRVIESLARILNRAAPVAG